MTDNEKLIVKAAITIREADGSLSHGDAVRYAKAALSVFEKAHTPTDDERPDIISSASAAFKARGGAPDWEEDAIARDLIIRWHLRGFEDGLAAGFRRSEVPEPSAPAQARGRSRGKHTDAQMLYMICLALEEGLEGVANIDLPDLIVKMIAEHWGTADEDISPEEAEEALAQLAPYIPDHMRTPEPQGEPSDAMVKAACEEYAAISFQRRVPQAYMRSALRAALRAAGGVR